ncbi:MAG: PIN domain-containing protein [Chloroflexi bacterium]|nr:PIN domain-containing protein [Chloroflexota bacterium]
MATQNSLLIDTNILVAAAYPKDINHQQAIVFFEVYIDRDLVVPAPVLSELFHVLLVREGYATALGAVAHTVRTFEVVSTQRSDYIRAIQIMRQHLDAQLDLTDATVMALAERLNIAEIATFDRRDFSIVRPKHSDSFTLLP